MATIREELILYDRFTDTFTKYLRYGEQAAGVTKEAQRATESYSQSQKAAAASTNTLTNSVRNLVGAFASIQTVKWLVNTSDQLTSINARLQLMTGSAEAAAAAQEEIYQAAMRSRGAYADMANFISQLGMMAGNAFSDTGELITFAEQIQKQMAISGASGVSAQAALVQLTQGLASGTLRGEELNSVLEQTPMIAQTIAKYMGVTTGEMRELASEGKVTADVVKNAMLSAAEETNAQFEQMPMTWAQVWTMFQNMAIKALNPVLDAISWLANNIETVGPIVLSLGAAFGVFLLAANWANICTAATTGLANAQKMLGAVMATTWGLPLIIIALVIAAVYAVTAAVNHFAGTSVSATGIIAGAFLSLASFILNGTVIPVMNAFSALGNFVGNFLNDPVAAVKVLIADMGLTILGWVRNIFQALEGLVNLIPGVKADFTSWLDGIYSGLSGWRQNVIDKSGYTEYFKTFEPIDLYGAASTGYNWGANLFSGSSSSGYGLNTAVAPYEEIANQLGGISDSVKGIEKSVNMSDEDIKALVDVAERRYVNQVNLTSQTPVINITGQNTGNTQRDRQALADEIMYILMEQRSAGSARATARPAVG